MCLNGGPALACEIVGARVYSQGGMLVPLYTQMVVKSLAPVIVAIETKEHVLIALKHS